MMKRPTLADLAELAEIVAALAAVVSLVYVGRELKSNTAAVRAEYRDISLLTAAEAYRFATMLRHRRVICELWTSPGVRATWNLHRRALDPGFADLVESCPAA